jgi:release factor glutamine methyltransferase
MELASDNLAAHGVGHLVTTVVADLLEGPEPRVTPDVVVANLPYVRTDEVAAGAGSLGWEPRAALDGGIDGLDVVRALLDRLPDRLATDGTVLLEIGDGQADPVRQLVMDLDGRWSVEAERDLSSIERVMRIQRRP